MSRVYVDTSAVYSLLVATDENHNRAVDAFRALEARTAPLATSSYVLVEIYALLGRRVGLDAVTAFRDDIEPLLEVTWIERDLHERGLDLLVARGRATLSLVDTTSFVLMCDEGIDEAFAYDCHFEKEGFTVIG